MDESEEEQNMKVVGNLLGNVSVKFGDFWRSFTYPTDDEKIGSKQGKFPEFRVLLNSLEIDVLTHSKAYDLLLFDPINMNTHQLIIL